MRLPGPLHAGSSHPNLPRSDSSGICSPGCGETSSKLSGVPPTSVTDADNSRHAKCQAYAKILVSREHQEAEKRSQDMAGELWSSVTKAVQSKADWDQVKGNFKSQSQLLLRVSR
jgi:hypothetical protein